MSRLALALQAATQKHLVVLGDMLLEVERCNSDQLRRQGWAELEGSSSAREALAIVQQQQMEGRELTSGKPAEASAARLKHHKKTVADQSKRRLSAMVARPEGQVAFVARCTAYLCAMVVRGGFARPDLEGVKEVASVGRLGVLPAGTDPAEVAVFKKGEPPLEPMRFVQQQDQEKPADGVLWVYRLTEEQRMAAGLVLIGLQSVAGEVTSFRGEAGSPARAGTAGKGVRKVPARGAGADAGASGAGGGGGGRAGRGSRKPR